MRFGKAKKDLELELTNAIQQDYTRLFVDVARALTSTLELEIVLTTVMTKMAQFFGPERWSMMLVDKEKTTSTTSSRWVKTPIASGDCAFPWEKA